MSNRKDLLRNKGYIRVFDEAAAVKDWIDIDVADNIQFKSATNPIEVKTPSGITIYQSADPDAEISFDWFHSGDLYKIALLFRGVVELDTYDGSTAQNETVIARFANQGDAFPLPGFDGDNTVVTVSAVVLDSNPSTAYTVTTDYTLSVDSQTGRSYITHVGAGSIPLDTDIRVTYSYTPLESRILRPVSNGQLVERHIEIHVPVDPNDATKYRKYYLPRCTVTSDLMHSHLEMGADNQTPNILPVTLRYKKPDTDSNEATWHWIDTYNV